MNLKQVQALSDEALRIKVAELLGWTGSFGMFRHVASGKQLLSFYPDVLHGTPPEDKGKPENECRYWPVPDYPSDLNACHEMEKALLDKGDNWAERYYSWLGEIGLHPMYHCTARQRCEAFVLTLLAVNLPGG